MGRFFRITAIRLSLIYLIVFAAFALALMFYINQSTSRILAEQLNDTIDAEINGLSEQYAQRGLRGLVALVDRRSRQPSANLYLLVNPKGEVLSGNISQNSEQLFESPNSDPTEIFYQRLEEDGVAEKHAAIVRIFALRGDYKILVGRDIGERDAIEKVISRALIFGGGVLVLLGLVTWVFVSHRVLKRVDSVSKTTNSIMSGDLSRRLQVTGSGDEFDRLATNLNHMLDRIEELLQGLKAVSDNIAHDLKTPLTRLRNRVEIVLNQKSTKVDYQQALEVTIIESDELIKTFNALLLIARIEARAEGDNLPVLDITEVVQDVVELYEPAADEQNIKLEISADGAFPVNGNRELISQMLANLIDNSLKYATGGEKILLSLSHESDQTVLKVADYGPGVDAKEHGRLIKRFQRLDESRNLPGSGLGLSLVSAVAGLHNAKMELSDTRPNYSPEENRGLTVKITFPQINGE